MKKTTALCAHKGVIPSLRSYGINALGAMVGPGNAVAIGAALACPPLVLYSLIPAGFCANAIAGAGGPLAVYLVTILAAEAGKLVSIVLPAVICAAIGLIFRRMGWILENDLKLDL